MTLDIHTPHREWEQRQAIAEELVPLIGRLHREHVVATTLYGRSLVNASAITILKTFRYGRRLPQPPLTLRDAYTLVHHLQEADLRGHPTLELTDLTPALTAQHSSGIDPDTLRAILDATRSTPGLVNPPTDVVLYGFGRIGRLIARQLITQTGTSNLRLRAIVVRKPRKPDLARRASLLRRDSIHGPFHGTITIDEEANTILANGTLISLLYAEDPRSIDYTQHDIHNAILVDNTGRRRTYDKLAEHLDAPGIHRVVVTAPASTPVKNIVAGVSDHLLDGTELVVSAASCTTNAVTPVLKVINDHLGIEHCHIETVHSFTNDQNLTDNFHDADRRGRAAGLNLVIAETGAAAAVVKALPELAGKLTGSAIRVPVPNVSLAILNLQLTHDTTKTALNELLAHASTSTMREQIDYTDSPDVVSSDFIGSTHAGIIDGTATISTGHNATIYIWYDNENGYSNQVTRILKDLLNDPKR